MAERPEDVDDTTGSELVDLEAVRLDDALVSRIASGAPEPGEQLTTLLSTWRARAVSPELPAHPDIDEAVVALTSAHPGRSARRWTSSRVLTPLAAAAVVGLALMGIGIAAHSSLPGEPLWGVSQALFANHTRSVQAAVDTDSQLDEATAALDSGEPEKAKQALVQAARYLSSVDGDEGREELKDRVSSLVDQVERAEPGTPTPPSTTRAPVPPVAGTTDARPAPPLDATDLLPPVTTRPPAVVDPPVAPTGPPGLPTQTPAPTNPPVGTPPPPPTTTVPPATTTPPPPPTTAVPPPTTPPPPTSVAPTATEASPGES